MTRSTGTSGLNSGGIAARAARSRSRMAARSTTAGTPVKSCISTRAGHERDVARRTGPGGERPDVVIGDVARARAAEEVLEQDQHGVGGSRQVGGGARFHEPTEPVEIDGAGGGLEGAARTRGVVVHRASLRARRAALRRLASS